MSSQNDNSESSTFSTSGFSTSGVSSFAKWIKSQLSRSDKSSKEKSTKPFSPLKNPTRVFATFPGPSKFSSKLSRKVVEKSLKRSKSLTSPSANNNNTTTTHNAATHKTATNKRDKNNPTVKKKRPNSICAEPNFWVNEEILESDDLIPKTIFSEPNIYELSQKDFVSGPSKEDCLENTFIVRGSIEHFAYQHEVDQDLFIKLLC
ncbi:18843_t:CDS:2, partial [Racocetra fulgida]